MGGRGGGVGKKPIQREELPKRGGLGQFADLGGGAWYERGGVDTQMQTMLCSLKFR